MATKLQVSHWTESVEDRCIVGKKRHARVKLTLSSTAGAFYPSSGGIPLPTTLGMVRNVDYVKVIQFPYPASGATGSADGLRWNYVVTEHAIHGYMAKYYVPTAATGGASPSAHVTEFPELPTTWNPSDLGTTPVMYVEAVGW